MAQVFSAHGLEGLRQAQDKDEAWSASSAGFAGKLMAEMLRAKHITFDVVVGLGHIGGQLAEAVAADQEAHVTWREIPRHVAKLNEYGQPELPNGAGRGRALLVTGLVVPDDRLSSLVYAVRAGNAIVTDMAMIADGGYYSRLSNPARDLGLRVHTLAE